MNSTDLENLYIKIDGHIRLVGAYTQNDNLVKIIKSCRLKPYSIFTNDFQPGTRFEKHWVDEFGNSLKFKNSDPYIVFNDTQIMENTKIGTDLFFGRSVRTTAQSSNFALVVSGNFLDKNLYMVALYGKDEYLRVFIHDGEWRKISPLTLGLKTLQQLFNNLGSLWVNELDKDKLDIFLNFDVEKCIVTSLPPKQNITSYFDNEIIINGIL